MATTTAYPSTRYTPKPLADLTSKQERARLSPDALATFFNIMEAWRVKDDDARALLGGITNGPFYEMKKHPQNKILEADRLYRISYLIGIFQALNILHSKALADDWVQLPNKNQMFGGSTPLSYMIRGGQAAMQNVRRLLDARRQGA